MTRLTMPVRGTPTAMTTMSAILSRPRRHSQPRIQLYHRSNVLDVVSRMPMPVPEAPTAPAKDTVLQMKFEPLYRIMLHYSLWNENDTKSIAQKVKISVPILTLRDCEKIVRHTQSYGMSMVCTVVKDKAVLYYENLVRVGLNATIEEA